MTSTSFITSTQRRALALEDAVHLLCQRYSIAFLRTALGLIFILFGALKFFPNLSPAQAIAEMTTEKLTLGLLPAQALLYFVAVIEVTVGFLLITRKALRAALWLLAFEMLAILSPLVLLPGELFAGPHHLPNLLGQYILKDFVLLGAVLVLFATQRAPITPRPEDHHKSGSEPVNARKRKTAKAGARAGKTRRQSR